jgi:exodeoxyribonuclease VII small subunit
LPKFEECLQRLEKIVDELEKGEVPLEKALALFQEGVDLSNSCRKELEAAEGKVEILLKQNGKLQPEPFETAETPAPTRRARTEAAPSSRKD